MSERSEHLIERAAAKLRGGSVVRMPEDVAEDAAIAARAAPVRPFTPVSPSPAEGWSAAEPVASAEAAAAQLYTRDVPDGVAGPIPPPSPPLTRPVMAAARPALSIPPSPPPARLAASPLVAPSPDDAPTPVVGPPPRGTPARTTGPQLAVRGFEAPAGPAASATAPLALQPPPIVQLDALERAGMVVARTTRTRISEEYRIAIGRILRVLHETGDVQGARNVLMVTSARPGEGKSFTALNLAGSIAQNGTDAVLLVDVDPKVKPLSDQLGLGDVQGFLDLVSDPSLRPEDLLRVTAIPNLAVMPIGTRLGGAAQTVAGTASMRPIIPTIARLARRFPKHLIMLDAPPCLSTSDPHTLAPHVGQVVVVVEAERTQRSEVEAAVDLVRVCPSITLLLNKVRMTTSHTFGAYDYFGSYT